MLTSEDSNSSKLANKNLNEESGICPSSLPSYINFEDEEFNNKIHDILCFESREEVDRPFVRVNKNDSRNKE